MRRIVIGVLLALGVPAAASAQFVPFQMAQPIPTQQYGAVGAQQGGGINPYAQVQRQAPVYQAPPVYYAPAPPVYQAPAQGYGQISPETGQPRTNYVNGYYRADGTYVQPYYRSGR